MRGEDLDAADVAQASTRVPTSTPRGRESHRRRHRRKRVGDLKSNKESFVRARTTTSTAKQQKNADVTCDISARVRRSLQVGESENTASTDAYLETAEDTRSEAVRRVLYARGLTTSLSETEQLCLLRHEGKAACSLAMFSCGWSVEIAC